MSEGKKDLKRAKRILAAELSKRESQEGSYRKTKAFRERSTKIGLSGQKMIGRERANEEAEREVPAKKDRWL